MNIPPRILVLGGTGFVGRQVCEQLARLGWRITVPTRRSVNAEAIQHLPGLTVVEASVHKASDLARLTKAGVRLKILGRRQGLPADIAAIIERAEAQTAHNDRFLLQVAFNYGGRADLVDAARRHMARMAAGETTEPLTEQALEAGLTTAGSPPLDLIVRTSGEQRLSNFLLWEAAYAELVFQDILWPDYGPKALAEAIQAFGRRDRRYGGRVVPPLRETA